MKLNDLQQRTIDFITNKSINCSVSKRLGVLVVPHTEKIHHHTLSPVKGLRPSTLSILERKGLITKKPGNRWVLTN